MNPADPQSRFDALVWPHAATVLRTARFLCADPADPAGVSVVRGQVEVATTEGQIESVSLVPEDPHFISP